MADDFIACTPKFLPVEMHEEAAERAVNQNPANAPSVRGLIDVPTPARIALTSKWWGSKGVNLTVGFMDNPPADLRKHIIEHMNAWGVFANVRFSATQVDPQVRIDRGDSGYWSFIGVDILSIPRNQPTMNLQGFSMQTPESEFIRVVRHETGHTIGAPHEHARREIVALLDPQKTIDYFGQTQGWSPQMVQQQILTPLEDGSLIGATLHADTMSIMTYNFPGYCTRSGQPIAGGTDIDASDKELIGKLYPLPSQPPPPPPPPPGGSAVTLAQAQSAADGAIDAYAAGVPWPWLLGSIVQGAKSPVDAALAKLPWGKQ